uniref:Uncharacterized protein n=2 Tax=Neobodo designis TaxID=312471 RepID=A0A7S1QYH8_NEODS|mmetsp:Transcript_54724/g.168591  ORF Transcript_54724/g.168591 Transcript_54724/m.168591 type:complete len:319 (+) Transcript_54724:206-1162(+)
MYQNVWHTLSDMYLIMHHTVQPLIDAEAALTWITESPRVALGSPKACGTLEACRRLSLFAAFDQLFEHRVFFASEGFGIHNDVHRDGGPPTTTIRRLRFSRVLLGLNTRCSPAPTDGLDARECHMAIEGMRRSLLRGVGLDDAAVEAPERKCPWAHVMSRQRDKYRRITPFDDMVSALRASYTARGCDPDRVRVYSLHGGMSLAEQIATIANSTILIAGRGGGTGYSPLLPRGGGYLSISGSDEWSPYRGLVPRWITMRHYRAKMVSHVDPSKPPQRFYKSQIVDANRVGYVVDPAKVVEAFWALADSNRERGREPAP